MEVKRIDEWVWAGYRDGQEVGRAGITECWPGRGYAWFDDKGLTSREWIIATRKVHEVLENARNSFHRIETAVYDGHEVGQRWAERFGFELESVCQKYMPDGSTGRIYVMFGEP